MPALPSPGAVLKCIINWGIDGDAMAQTVHYFRYTGSADAGDVETFAAALVSEGSSQFQALATSFTGMNAATVRDLASEMGVEETGGTPWVGTRTGDRTPPGSAVVVSHTIDRHYRGGHPRTYLPLGAGSDIASTGLWATGLLTAVDSAWGAWTAAVTTSYGSLTVSEIVNVSYYQGYEYVNRGTSSNPKWVRVPTVRSSPQVDTITGHVTRKNIGTQKRRNRSA